MINRGSEDQKTIADEQRCGGPRSKITSVNAIDVRLAVVYTNDSGILEISFKFIIFRDFHAM